VLRAAVLAGPLARRPEWPFVPHVTILPEASPERLEAGVAALTRFSASVAFRSVHVLRQGDDHSWRSVAELALGPPAVIGRGGLPLELAVSADLDIQARRLADGSFAVTARREDAVVGVAVGWVSGDVLRLERLVVSPAAQHQGIGSHLVAAVEQVAVREGCERLVAFDEASVDLRFLVSHGWVASEAAGAARELS